MSVKCNGTVSLLRSEDLTMTGKSRDLLHDTMEVRSEVLYINEKLAFSIPVSKSKHLFASCWSCNYFASDKNKSRHVFIYLLLYSPFYFRSKFDRTDDTRVMRQVLPLSASDAVLSLYTLMKWEKFPHLLLLILVSPVYIHLYFASLIHSWSLFKFIIKITLLISTRKPAHIEGLRGVGTWEIRLM